MKTNTHRVLISLCWSLAFFGLLLVANRAVERGIKIAIVHVIATPNEVKMKP